MRQLDKYKSTNKRSLHQIDIDSNTNNTNSEPSTKKRKIVNDTKNRKFTWCVSRKQLVVREAISEKLFAMVESQHDEVVQRIYETACSLDPIFFNINAKEVKSMIYKIQRKVASTATEKISTLAVYEQTFRETLKNLGQLDGAFYVRDSTS